MLNNVLQFLTHNANRYIAGRVAGTEAFGFYSVGSEIGWIPAQEIIFPINRAAYPGLAKIADDKAQLTQMYKELLAYIAMLVFPVGLGIYSVAPMIGELLLGSEWVGSVIYIQIFCLIAIVVSLGINSNLIFIVCRKQYLSTVARLLNLFMFFVFSYLLLSRFSVEGVAWSIFLASVVELIILIVMVKILLKVGFFDLIKLLYRPLLSSLVMCFLVLHGFYLIFIDLSVQGLFLSVVFGVISYLLLCYLLCVLAGWNDCREVCFAKKILSKIIPSKII
jgi:O-antigen/teichoic acid export membrane protein